MRTNHRRKPGRYNPKREGQGGYGGRQVHTLVWMKQRYWHTVRVVIRRLIARASFDAIDTNQHRHSIKWDIW